MRSLPRWSLLVVVVVGAGAGLAVSATGHGSRRVLTTFATTQGQPFAEPRVLTSRDGVLATTLTVSPTTYEVAGTPIRGKAYDGAFIGPTMRVRPGDRIELRFRNQLDEATNIHFHGFHVSPAGISDNGPADDPRPPHGAGRRADSGRHGPRHLLVPLPRAPQLRGAGHGRPVRPDRRRGRAAPATASAARRDRARLRPQGPAGQARRRGH